MMRPSISPRPTYSRTVRVLRRNISAASLSVSRRSGVRTTVYTNVEGQYEFPKVETGSYILRIPTPLEFKPYWRDSVSINGPTKLDDIVLENVSKSDSLPPTPEIEAQLTGAELLWNLPGTAEEKATFQKACSPCHGWDQIFRNRYDERGWSLIIDRMMHYYSMSLAVRIKGKPVLGTTEQDYNTIVNWLSKVRSPEFKDPPLRVFPRPHGASTRVVVTEYELPRTLLLPHDVEADSKGNIWYTSHKTEYIGKLDPRTGIVTEYKIPLTPNAMPGTHRVFVDKKDIVWVSEPWGHILDRVDPQAGKITQVPIPVPNPLMWPDSAISRWPPMASFGITRTITSGKSIRPLARSCNNFPIRSNSVTTI
jgi:virginiamycin B lyase